MSRNSCCVSPLLNETPWPRCVLAARLQTRHCARFYAFTFDVVGLVVIQQTGRVPHGAGAGAAAAAGRWSAVRVPSSGADAVTSICQCGGKEAREEGGGTRPPQQSSPPTLNRVIDAQIEKPPRWFLILKGAWWSQVVRVHRHASISTTSNPLLKLKYKHRL